ncbi:MAG: tetratricopeptide repeat protein [Myxococcales bacterium]|nr:tetratricopeptide repeat protein [Myxococcales bacterium]
MSRPPMGASASELPEIPGFELERRLGSGGMAEVFLAKKRGAEGTFKQLVLKRILPDHGKARRFRNMFVDEADLATRLNHPNIVQVYEFSHHNNDLLLSMEYVDGVDLGRLQHAAAKRECRIAPAVAAFIAVEVAKGLHYAHERKDEGGLPLSIVHRDISPQNVLISSGGVVKIADFGIATANLFREEQGMLVGKLGYMSPEQARGDKVDRRSDVYALGVVLYELLAGRSPYGSVKGELLQDALMTGIVKAPSHHEPAVPAALDAIVLKAMARDPVLRYQTARELGSDLARFIFEERELVDHAVVEDTLRELFGPDGFGAGAGPAQPTLAAVRRAGTSLADNVVGTAEHQAPARAAREVRHVAVVRLHIDGLAELDTALGSVAAAREVAATRATLGDIAFKRRAEWSWDSAGVAHAIVGLMAMPAQAPDDAAMLAVDVHDFLASRSEELPVQLRAAVSIVRGVTAGERDDNGHLVNYTLQSPARDIGEQLAEKTPFGKTWVAGGVYRLVRRGFRWADGPALIIADGGGAGLPERMRVYVLLRPLTAEERMLETALNPHDLVGRDAEKADLHAAFHRVVYSPGRTSEPPPDDRAPSEVSRAGELLARVIVGEMGIGKTALVNAFISELPDSLRAFRVECSPVTIDLPYDTVADLVREVLGLSEDASEEDAKEAVRNTMRLRRGGPGERLVVRLAQLVSGTHVELADEDAAAQHHDLSVRAVRLLIGIVAETGPVVIVIDGIQWADRASLEVLKRVLERPETSPILTLLVTRPDERVEPYLEGLMRSELRGLTVDEQLRLVQLLLGVRHGAVDVCRALAPRVSGNPYFLLEIVDALLERGALEIVGATEEDDARLVRHDARFEELAEQLPSTVEQLLADRLNELPSAEFDIVAWLAVAGGPIHTNDLTTLTRRADDDATTRLCARGICDRKGPQLDLRYPLARDVAYNSLEAPARVRMHRRLGEHLAPTSLARGLSAAIVAQHFERGELPLRAAELYVVAAQAARSSHQAQLAVRYFAHALELLPLTDERRLVAHDSLVRLHRQLGDSNERRRHLVMLQRLSFASEKARWLSTACLRSAELDLDDGAFAHGLPLAERAAELARLAHEPDLEVDALSLKCELLRDLGDVNRALEVCEEALRTADEKQVSRRARGEVLRAKGVLLRRAGRLHAALETYADAIALFTLEGARRSEARARNALGFSLFVLGRYEDSIAMCLSALAISRSSGVRFQLAKTLSNIGMAYARLGDVERGLVYLRRARDSHERFEDFDGRVDTLLVLASVLIEHGRLDEAREAHGDAAALIDDTSSVYDRIHEMIVSALLHRANGDPARARDRASLARHLAESQALVSYHVYATALEAVTRVELGEIQTGLMLTTTSLGAVEGMEGSEYGIEVRGLCCEAVLRATQAERAAGHRSAMMLDVCHRALNEVDRVAGYVRDPHMRELFFKRPPVIAISSSTVAIRGPGELG